MPTIYRQIKRNDIGDREATLRNLSKFVASTQFEGKDTRAVLQPWVWKSENARYLKYLEESSAEGWKKGLEAMIDGGASIFTATRGQELVGTVILVQYHDRSRHCAGELQQEVQEIEGHKPTSRKGKNKSEWLGEVEQWGTSSIREYNLSLSNKRSIALNMAQYQDLWEISGVGVHRDYRRQGIARQLVWQALTAVPPGAAVRILAEPDMVSLYSSLGFQTMEYVSINFPSSQGTIETTHFPIMIWMQPQEGEGIS